MHVGCTTFGRSHLNAPEIPQDEDSHDERAQRDGVAHRVDEIQPMKDVLLKDDQSVTNTQHILPLTPETHILDKPRCVQ